MLFNKIYQIINIFIVQNNGKIMDSLFGQSNLRAIANEFKKKEES